ncbi:MAG: hypothetical protein QG656_1002, partial [Candidatus Hydrogenedentes bacterium]|nr:hypothetical protein [Candidatus Hydrogenedentota bacterium]
MKMKNLVPLLVILVILGILVVAKKSQESQPNIVEQAKLVALMPEGVSKGDIVKLELYAGAKPEEKIRLLYNAESSKWRLDSHFNALAKDEKVTEYLDALMGIKGEYREKAASEEALKTFNLTDDTAFHVTGFKKDADAPAFHLLVGVAPGAAKTVFMRQEGGQDVFVEATDLRQLAGLYGDETDKPPTSDAWLEKQILNLDKAKIAKLTLTYPDKQVVFEQHEKKVDPPAEEKAEGAEADAAPKPEPTVEYEWKLAQGGPGGEFKQAGLDKILRKLDSLSVVDVADPAKKAEWGLETPAFKCVVTMNDGSPEVVIEGGLPNPGKDGFIRVASNTEDLAYRLASYGFTELWPKGSELFDLPAIAANKDDVVRIDIDQPEGRIVLTKTDGMWQVEEPKADLLPLSSTLNMIAQTMAALKGTDYADSADAAGLTSPAKVATITTKDGSHKIALGSNSPCLDGFYAQIDGGPAAVAVTKMDADKIFVKPNDLYDRSLADLIAEDIQEISVQHGAESFVIARTETGWNRTVGAETAEASREACDAYVTRVADLEAETIRFGQTALEGETAGTIAVKSKDGVSYSLTLGAEKDGVTPVAVSGKAQLFTLASGDVKALLVPADEFKKAEPAPAPAPAEPAPAAEAAAPAAAPEMSVPPTVTIEAPAPAVEVAPATPPTATIEVPASAAEAPAAPPAATV